MPSVSKVQQSLMGAAYARKKAGHPRATDPKMSVSQLREFAATPTHNLPSRAPKREGYGSGPVSNAH